MYSGLNLKYGLSLRPYGGGGSSDPYFDKVTVLYGFEDADLSSGVNNDGSLAAGTVTAKGVTVTTSDHFAGSQCAAFNRNGALSNDGILIGPTTDVLGSGDFTIEGWFKDSGAAFCIFSAGSGASPRFVLHCPVTNEVRATFGSSIDYNSKNGVWPSNEWFHYACVYVSATSTFSIYINGALVMSGKNALDRASNAYIGQHVYTPQPLNGPDYLDEFRITKVARYSGTSFTVPDAPFPRRGN